MGQEQSYIAFLSNDSYLEGVLVLHYSLQKTKPRFPFLVLATPNVSHHVLNRLHANKIVVKVIEPIKNPAEARTRSNWESTYSKLRIFEQRQFTKIVYLDADMLICKNIDKLFDKPHMTAADNRLPEFAHIVQFNTGLMVIEPDKVDARDLISKVGKIEAATGSATGSDEHFLHAYFPDWPKRQELHLDPKFNMFCMYLDRYHKVFGYRLIEDTDGASQEDDEKLVSVIHYVPFKPWSHMPLPLLSWWTRRTVPNSSRGPLSGQALRLWRDFRQELQDSTR
jgi:alpha-N-acetylglucosamine transferase